MNRKFIRKSGKRKYDQCVKKKDRKKFSERGGGRQTDRLTKEKDK